VIFRQISFYLQTARENSDVTIGKHSRDGPGSLNLSSAEVSRVFKSLQQTRVKIFALISKVNLFDRKNSNVPHSRD